MLLKTNNLKFINNLKSTLAICTLLLVGNVISAQEIINEEVAKPETTKKDSINTQNAKKVDGVAAVVGEYIILDSDIPKNRLQLEASGYDSKDISDCELFGKLLEDKLYAHWAIQDSIQVSDAEIRRNVDYQVEQFLTQSGKSMPELLAFYKKDDEKSFRDEMFEINKGNELAKKNAIKNYCRC